jgi:hypothetical protein
LKVHRGVENTSGCRWMSGKPALANPPMKTLDQRLDLVLWVSKIGSAKTLACTVGSLQYRRTSGSKPCKRHRHSYSGPRSVATTVWNIPRTSGVSGVESNHTLKLVEKYSLNQILGFSSSSVLRSLMRSYLDEGCRRMDERTDGSLPRHVNNPLPKTSAEEATDCWPCRRFCGPESLHIEGVWGITLGCHGSV